MPFGSAMVFLRVMDAPTRRRGCRRAPPHVGLARGAADAGADDAGCVEDEGRRGLQHVEPGGDVGPVGRSRSTWLTPSVDSAIWPSTRRVGTQGAHTSVENCSSVAFSPRVTSGRSTASVLVRRPGALTRPLRDFQTRPSTVASATSPRRIATTRHRVHIETLSAILASRTECERMLRGRSPLS